MKSIFPPIILAIAILGGIWHMLTLARADETVAEVRMQTALTELRQKENDLAQNQIALAKETASLEKAKTFLRLWKETYERGSLLDDGVFGGFAGRNGVVTQKKQHGLPTMVQLPNGSELSATKMSFTTQGAFSRSLRLLGEIEEAYELANIVEARFSQQGPDLSSNFTIYYPILKFTNGPSSK